MKQEDMHYLDMIERTTEILSEDAYRRVTLTPEAIDAAALGRSGVKSKREVSSAADNSLHKEFGLRPVDDEAEDDKSYDSDNEKSYFDTMQNQAQEEEKTAVLNELYNSLIIEKQKSNQNGLGHKIAVSRAIAHDRKTQLQSANGGSERIEPIGEESDQQEKDSPIRDFGLNEDVNLDYLDMDTPKTFKKDGNRDELTQITKPSNEYDKVGRQTAAIDARRASRVQQLAALVSRNPSNTIDQQNKQTVGMQRENSADKQVVREHFAPSIDVGIKKLKPVFSNVKYNRLELPAKESVAENTISKNQSEIEQSDPTNSISSSNPKPPSKRVLVAPPEENPQRRPSTPINDKISQFYQQLPDDERIQLEIQYKQKYMEIMNDLFAKKAKCENSDTSILLKQKMREMVSVEFLYYCHKLPTTEINKIIKLQRFYRKRTNLRIIHKIHQSERLFDEMRQKVSEGKTNIR